MYATSFLRVASQPLLIGQGTGQPHAQRLCAMIHFHYRWGMLGSTSSPSQPPPPHARGRKRGGSPSFHGGGCWARRSATAAIAHARLAFPPDLAPVGAAARGGGGGEGWGIVTSGRCSRYRRPAARGGHTAAAARPPCYWNTGMPAALTMRMTSARSRRSNMATCPVVIFPLPTRPISPASVASPTFSRAFGYPPAT